MRKILFLLFVVVALIRCNNDDRVRFDVSIERDQIKFEPIPGGAIMRYTLDDPAINALKINYMNSVGVNVTKQGTYMGDSILLDGFNEAKTDEPVFITLLNINREESETIKMYFDTKESAPYAFFNEVEVSPYWNGFQVVYKAPETVEGYANVFYMGINPMTKELDTLLLGSYLLKSGGDTLLFALEQQNNVNTVIIRTEDFKGNVARQQTWEGVKSYEMMNLSNRNFTLSDPLKLSKEKDQLIGTEKELPYKTGIKYLFDGDILGSQKFTSENKYAQYTFVAGPNAVGAPFILDIKERHLAARLRLYVMRDVSGGFGDYWNLQYVDKIPNEITIYASNTPADDNSWIKVGYYFETPEYSSFANRWYYLTSDGWGCDL